jgi:transaldolase / glucose-6-phosphate isomerase
LALSRQTIQAGELQSAFRAHLAKLAARDSVKRLYAKDLSLWPNAAANSRPGAVDWIELPERIGEYMRQVTARTREAPWANFESILFVGISSANLAATAVHHLFPDKLIRKLVVLDTTEPSAIAAIEREVDLVRTVVVVATKSGRLIETHAVLLFLLNRLRELGVMQPGKQFVAVSEENSYLSVLAKQYHFFESFHDPGGIAGRYSGLIHFDLLFSALCQVDAERLHSQAKRMKELCGPLIPPEQNPALELAALLAAIALNGDWRVRLIGEKKMVPLLRVIAGILASTCKDRQGLIPLVEEGSLEGREPRRYSTAVFRISGRENEERSEAHESTDSSPPVVTVDLESADGLGAEVLKWQIATALASSLLEVNPFAELQSQAKREPLIHALQTLEAEGDLQLPRVRVTENGIEMRAEGATRQNISTLSLVEALRSFLQFRAGKGYCALLSFARETPENLESLTRIRRQIESRIGTPVTIEIGPRFIHATGKVYREGPRGGIFLVLTENSESDVAVPGAVYSFGQLHRALALGEFEARVETGAHVLWLNFVDGAAQGLAQLEAALQGALGGIRPDA